MVKFWKLLLTWTVLSALYVTLLRRPEVTGQHAKESVLTVVWLYASLVLPLSRWPYAQLVGAVLKVWAFGWLLWLALGFWPATSGTWSQMPNFVDYLFVMISGLGLVDSLQLLCHAWIATRQKTG